MASVEPCGPRDEASEPHRPYGSMLAVARPLSRKLPLVGMILHE